jgi:glucokinase
MVMQIERCVREGVETTIPPNGVTTRALMAAVAEGDALACRILADARQTLAATLCFALHLLAPDVVVLAGGLCTDESWFVTPLQRLVHDQLAVDRLRQVPIRRAALWDAAVSWGAIELAASLTG